MTDYPTITNGMSVDVTQGTQPSITFQYLDRGNNILDLTGQTLKLAVKRSLDDIDSYKLFDLTGTVETGTDGLITFDFTGVHTGLAGSFPGSIRRWASGVDTDSLPEDAYSVTFNVSSAVIRDED